MSKLKTKLAEKIPGYRERISRLVKEYGDVVVDQVKISQFYGGMRSLKSLTTDISYLDPEEGIRFRGYTIPECLEKLPKPKGAEMPYVEGHFYLLLTGEIPSQSDIEDVIQDFKKRSKVPQYVFDVLRAMPDDSHPMTMFSAAILALQKESVFVTQYNAGMSKMDYWDPTYEDGMNLLAKLPEVAAFIYRLKYKGDKQIKPNPDLDFGANYAHMMGIKSPYEEISRLYFILHSDHESGNVSAHTTHLVASALSDPYYALSAGLNGLAGPLHGLANQEVLRWIQQLMEKMGNKLPSKDELKKFVWDTLKSGQVIPGYGHAVLRKTDPRYTAQREFSLKHLPDDQIFKLVSMVYEVVPPILLEQGKAKNPWPNVDAHSGVIQWHYGVTEYDYYTVMFGVGRALGVLSNIIWDRAVGQALERPKSLTTDMLEKIAGIK
ncbi:MAG: citrate (Si)-synthase, eukaryotic [Calditrichaceae bacterium]|nr:citrate (Si)-synthase, eukaryotic [Calditrichaceae bacterium]MBN2710425.1 citrate (Si)-synthase, eukaryotic [Calditrichaceae bacterium]RQV93637.1 MAG: citrate (Si)-synthase, eukaryotic [Calditrichota bacterium]